MQLIGMRHKVQLLACLAGFIVGAMAYWVKPLDQLNLFGNYILPVMGTGALVATLIISRYRPGHAKRIAFIVATGALIAVIGRIAFDGVFLDSSSHNLAGIEVIISAVIAFTAALLGAALSWLIDLLRKRSN